jgi:hypothetical protein
VFCVGAAVMYFAVLTVRTGRDYHGSMISATLDAPSCLKMEVLNTFRAHTASKRDDYNSGPRQDTQSVSETTPLVFYEHQCTELSTSRLLQWITETGQVPETPSFGPHPHPLLVPR